MKMFLTGETAYTGSVVAERMIECGAYRNLKERKKYE